MTQSYNFILVILFIANSIGAQRYVTEIFPEVQITEDVAYGVNATVLFQENIGVVKQNLICDIYEPMDDILNARPLVLVFHSGNFLPPVANGQIIGTNKDNSVVEICTQLARRGFVAASVSYRQGWNPLAPTQPERASGFIQALYRGIQDGRTAIRYIKKTVNEENNPYKVDAEKIACWGLGTGGYIVLGMVGLTDYNEVLETDQLYLDKNMDGVLESPMIDTLFLGDPEAKTLALVSTVGVNDTLCFPNYPEYESDFEVAVNIGGGIVDTSWLDDQLIPIISVQSINDMFTPYNKPSLIVANEDLVLEVFGAQRVGKMQEANGINALWKEYGFNDPISQLAVKNAELANHPYYEGSFPYVQHPNSKGFDEGVVLDWWDPESSSLFNGLFIPWNILPHPSGGSYHEQGLILNEAMSSEKAKANIDTVMQYVIPRLMLRMELSELVQAAQFIEDEPMLRISPNPAGDYIEIDSESGPIKSIQVLNGHGRIVQKFALNSVSSCRIDRLNLLSGVYFVRVQINDYVICKRIVFL